MNGTSNGIANGLNSTSHHPGRLQDKVAVVTGSSSGLGREIAITFARHGAKVVCADLQPQARVFVDAGSVKATHKVISDMGGHSLFIRLDVSDSTGVQRMIEKTVQEFGRVDIIVNNAGIAPEVISAKATNETDEEIFNRMLQVNIAGVFLCCKYAGQQMIKQEAHPCGDRGWIVNMASGMGLVGRIGAVGYTSTKGAVVNMTKTIALDYACHRIHVNAIAPGWIRTAMTKPLTDDANVEKRLLQDAPFRGLGEPQDVANAAVFFASEDCSYITGVTMPVDGGYMAGDAQ